MEASLHGGIIKLIVAQTPTYAVLEVSDEGTGIPPGLVQEILRKGISFGKSSGNALGLTSAKKMIETEWRGEISLDSQVGKGTRVSIKIPRTS